MFMEAVLWDRHRNFARLWLDQNAKCGDPGINYTHNNADDSQEAEQSWHCNERCGLVNRSDFDYDHVPAALTRASSLVLEVVL